MTAGIRFKLFFAFFSFVLIGLGITGFVLSHYLKKNIIDRTEDELLGFAKSTRLLIENYQGPIDEADYDRWADQVSAAILARVTVIRLDGTVLGDSDQTLEEVRKLENHGDRREVQDARRMGFGTSTRYSTTTLDEMLYVALRFQRGSDAGIIRVSTSLVEVSRAISGLRRILLFASLAGLIIAALMSAGSSHFFSRRLRTLVSSAQQLVKGEVQTRIEEGAQDELGGLAGSLNNLSDKLEEYVAQLAEKRDQFEAVLNGMSEAVIATDERQHVTLINRAGTILLGITGRPIGKMLLETVRIPVLHELAAFESGESHATREFDLHINSQRRILARATKLTNGGAVIVLLDVTELRRLERIRRDFVSNVSHELRTPIAIIQANAETLRDGALEDPEAASRFLDAMITNAKRLSNLIADLLDISRIEEGKFDLQLVPVSVSAALHRSAAALETKAIERNFTIEIEPCLDTVVSADARALDQVLFNLLDNAVKYAGQGGRVRMRAIAEDAGIRIEVEDNGPGIEPRYRDRLFERFFRIDKGRSREMGGTGLGLAIVKHLTAAMRGETGMKPAAPHGSIFWVLLNKAVE